MIVRREGLRDVHSGVHPSFRDGSAPRIQQDQHHHCARPPIARSDVESSLVILQIRLTGGSSARLGSWHACPGACLAIWAQAVSCKCANCNMAPNKPKDSSVDHNQEYEEFLDTLAEYHEKRGWVVESFAYNECILMYSAGHFWTANQKLVADILIYCASTNA